LDVARWTFTSTQLQAIVSKAIRQSAEAYSIRLLPLEILENDIPDEMHRLDMLGTDVKAQYKAMCRRRQGLLQSLSAHMEGSSTADPAAGLKLLNELAETSEASDRLAEELHSVDEQIANVRSLRDVHSASALAMALRKLNQSFQREMQATRALQQQVAYLESERDEAWKHAEEVANDFDDFTEKVVESNGLHMSMSTRPSSRRSSRVTAVRKSSVRALKASGRMPGSSEEIPPVPPIPIPNPLGIETNLPSRSSMGKSMRTSLRVM
jgi:chromosome segregation ATPase